MSVNVSQSNIIIDVYPYDTNTTSDTLQAKIKGVNKNGVTWLCFNRTDAPFEFYKLQCMARVDNSKVTSDDIMDMFEDAGLQYIVSKVSIVSWHWV